MIPIKAKVKKPKLTVSKFKVKTGPKTDAEDILSKILKGCKMMNFKDEIFCSRKTGENLIALGSLFFKPVSPTRARTHCVRLPNFAVKIDDSLKEYEFKTIHVEKSASVNQG